MHEISEGWAGRDGGVTGRFVHRVGTYMVYRDGSLSCVVGCPKFSRIFLVFRIMMVENKVFSCCCLCETKRLKKRHRRTLSAFVCLFCVMVERCSYAQRQKRYRKRGWESCSCSTGC